MTVEELIIYGKKYIHSTYAEMLLSNLLDINCLEIINYLDKIVDTKLVEIYKKQVEAVKIRKPIQYVIGNVDFYGNIIDINENVLIPRFETEELVEKTVGYIKKMFNKKVDIVDIGTGSGCISIALKNLLDCNIDAVDISSDALEVANKNIKKFNLDINLYKGNLFEPLDKKYDVIISNPPYISYDEKIMDIVKDNEPNIALYAPDNGLFFYKEMIKNCKNYLNDKSLIAFEIGSTQGKEIKEYALKYFPNAKIKVEKDLKENDRFVFIFND